MLVPPFVSRASLESVRGITEARQNAMRGAAPRRSGVPRAACLASGSSVSGLLFPCATASLRGCFPAQPPRAGVLLCATRLTAALSPCAAWLRFRGPRALAPAQKPPPPYTLRRRQDGAPAPSGR